MFNLKNLKIVKHLKSIKPKLKWLMFSQIQDYKINSKYIDMICSDAGAKTQNERHEQMVRESLIKEFSPEIHNMKSYELLVSAAVPHLTQKQIAQLDAQFSAKDI